MDSMRLNYILEMATKGVRDNIVNIPLMINFEDIYGDIVPGAHEEIDLEDGNRVITDVIFQLFIYKEDNTNLKAKFDSMHLLALEHKVIESPTGERIGKPENNSFTILTRYERKQLDDYDAARLAEATSNTSIPKELRNVRPRENYISPISDKYSDILEDYIDGKNPLESFLDALVPVVELNRATIVKVSVLNFINKYRDNWVQLISNNLDLVDLGGLKETYSPFNAKNLPKQDLKALDDVREALVNYMNCSANVLSILSAKKRGGKVSTTDILQSCPELTKREALLDKVTEVLKVSHLSTELPLFSADFMKVFLMGYIPLFLISDNPETEATFMGSDLFKEYKELLVRNCDLFISSLIPTASGNTLEVLSNINKATTSVEMTGMYSKYLKSGKVRTLSKMLDGSYKCYFVDAVVYTEALKHYKNRQLVDCNLFDFLNLISPVKLKREEI